MVVALGGRPLPQRSTARLPGRTTNAARRTRRRIGTRSERGGPHAAERDPAPRSRAGVAGADGPICRPTRCAGVTPGLLPPAALAAGWARRGTTPAPGRSGGRRCGHAWRRRHRGRTRRREDSAAGRIRGRRGRGGPADRGWALPGRRPARTVAVGRGVGGDLRPADAVALRRGGLRFRIRAARPGRADRNRMRDDGADGSRVRRSALGRTGADPRADGADRAAHRSAPPGPCDHQTGPGGRLGTATVPARLGPTAERPDRIGPAAIRSGELPGRSGHRNRHRRRPCTGALEPDRREPAVPGGAATECRHAQRNPRRRGAGAGRGAARRDGGCTARGQRARRRVPGFGSRRGDAYRSRGCRRTPRARAQGRDRDRHRGRIPIRARDRAGGDSPFADGKCPRGPASTSGGGRSAG
ncbi:Uncharacterised protein [Mycobacteroides abscessus subsp. abscessus]|nr:Uncharacterised protein [Mycobacteroides abscessus subsp. abscessus]